MPRPRVLRAAGPLHVLYKHLSHSPKPVTLHSTSCTCTLVQVTSLNLDCITFPLFSCIFLFLSRTQHESLTKLLCQDLAQHNTVYSSFSCSFLSFFSKFLILYVRSIKQLNIYVAFPAPLHYQELLKSFPLEPSLALDAPLARLEHQLALDGFAPNSLLGPHGRPRT